MDNLFTSTWLRGATRRLLINNERILFVERIEKETTVYIVHFDTGQELELDEGTGKALEHGLAKVDRPSPSVQYIPAPDPYPRYPRRRDGPDNRERIRRLIG